MVTLRTTLRHFRKLLDIATPNATLIIGVEIDFHSKQESHALTNQKLECLKYQITSSFIAQFHLLAPIRAIRVLLSSRIVIKCCCWYLTKGYHGMANSI